MNQFDKDYEKMMQGLEEMFEEQSFQEEMDKLFNEIREKDKGLQPNKK